MKGGSKEEREGGRDDWRKGKREGEQDYLKSQFVHQTFTNGCHCQERSRKL